MEVEIVFFVIGISIVVLVLILTIVLIAMNSHRRNVTREQAFKIEKKNLEMQFLEAQIFTLEDERQRMANSFHDDVNPLLAALKNQIKLCSIEFKNGQFDEDKSFQMNNLIDNIIEHQNASIKNLAPKMNNVEDLELALISYFSIVSEFVVDYSSDVQPELHIDQDILKNAYSIVLELVHNIAKYEKIDVLHLLFQADNFGLKLVLKHKGKGIKKDDFIKSVKLKEGRGLPSIYARITHLNAKLDLLSNEDGALIIVSIPNNNGKRN